MPMNRIQFQPGLSMPEFFEQYGSESRCEAAFERLAGQRAFAVLAAVRGRIVFCAVRTARCSSATPAVIKPR